MNHSGVNTNHSYSHFQIYSNVYVFNAGILVDQIQLELLRQLREGKLMSKIDRIVSLNWLISDPEWTPISGKSNLIGITLMLVEGKHLISRLHLDILLSLDK
jgi:hypothetical protein